MIKTDKHLDKRTALFWVIMQQAVEITDISVLPNSLFFKGQESNAEEHSSHLLCGGSLKSDNHLAGLQNITVDTWQPI